ncbi:uncharacterized protein LOC142766287 [Rhipicephalus microplus]|uniref:uncharacterized protein LOC142766287 n=1 Tax=Rhipicephalus microplus TaxID=6941 RepID=UPI003F6CA50D
MSGLGDTRAMAWAHRKTVFLMQLLSLACSPALPTDTPGCAINAIPGHHVPSSEIPVPPDNQSSNLRFWHVLQRRCPVENASTWLPPALRMLYKWPREIGSPSTTPGAYKKHPRTGAHFSGLGDTRAMAWAHRKTVFLMQLLFLACSPALPKDTPGCAINAIPGHHVPSSEIPVPPDNQSSNLRFWHVLQRRCPVENASTWLPPALRMLYKWPREIGSPSTTTGAYKKHPRTGAHFSGLGDTRAMAWAHRKTVFLMQPL